MFIVVVRFFFLYVAAADKTCMRAAPVMNNVESGAGGNAPRVGLTSVPLEEGKEDIVEKVRA